MDTRSAVSTAVAPTALQETARSSWSRFARNVASLGSVQLANMLLPLLTVPYVVRIIGPDRLGLLNFAQAYTAYFTLLINYGFEMSAVRAIAADRTNRALVNRIFSEVMLGKALLWVLASVLFAILTLQVPELRTHFWLHFWTYLSCAGYVLFPIWLFQAMEDLGRVALLNLAVRVLFAASVLLLIREPEDYFYQNLSLSGAQILVSLVALRMAVRRFRVAFILPTAARMCARFREDLMLFLSSLTITLYANSTVFLLGLVSTAYSVGIFSAGVRLESIARSFVGLALNQAFFPIAAREFGKSRATGVSAIQRLFFPLVLLLCAISLAIWLVAPWFITFFYGAGFSEAVAVLRIVAVLTLTIGVSNLLGFHTMINLRLDRAFFAITAGGAVLGVGLTVLLAQRFDHLGAAWAWVIVEAYTTLAMLAYLRAQGVELGSWRQARAALQHGRARLAFYLK